MNHKFLLLLFIPVLLVACSNVQNWLALRFAEAAPSLVVGDAANGEKIFRTGVADAPPCIGCHRVSEGGFGLSLAPKLIGIAARAGDRIEGFTAEAYIQDSILHPQHFVVPGYHVSMYPDYAQHLSEQDVADLVAYLMTL